MEFVYKMNGLMAIAVWELVIGRKKSAFVLFAFFVGLYNRF